MPKRPLNFFEDQKDKNRDLGGQLSGEFWPIWMYSVSHPLHDGCN
jgi:hypothetical protein